MTLAPLAALDELGGVVMREVELTVGGVLGCARVARDNKQYSVRQQLTYLVFIEERPL